MTISASDDDSSYESSMVRTMFLPGGDSLPRVIEPGEHRSVAALVTWLDAERQRVAHWLRRHGAILLRGFEVYTALDFEKVARVISPDLKNDYLGTSPRDALTPYVFSASELPSYYPIPQHCEMSFVPHPPRRLFFCCLVAPRAPGGETPLVDFRRVYRDLDSQVRDRFVRLGVRNIRNYCGPQGGSRLDLWKLKRWDEMFQTTERSEVERRCRDSGFDFTWLPGGRLRLTHVQPAFLQHPETGDPVWFNHAQVFHLSAAPGEYRRIARRLGLARYHLLHGVASAAVFVKRHFTRTEEQAMHCTYGDGTPIDDGDMEHVREAIWRNLVCYRWQAGDVVAIDNLAVAHGRMPYSGPRQIAVCWD